MLAITPIQHITACRNLREQVFQVVQRGQLDSSTDPLSASKSTNVLLSALDSYIAWANISKTNLDYAFDIPPGSHVAQARVGGGVE